MPRFRNTGCLREKAAEYRRRAAAIDHPGTVADLLNVAKKLELMAVQAEHESRGAAEPAGGPPPARGGNR